jgi:hypothetical protein
MAGNGQTLGARISRWNTLVINLEPDLPDMQHLAGDIAQLKEILRKSREFEAQFRQGSRIEFFLVGDHAELRVRSSPAEVPVSGLGMLTSRKCTVPADFDPASLL